MYDLALVAPSEPSGCGANSSPGERFVLPTIPAPSPGAEPQGQPWVVSPAGSALRYLKYIFHLWLPQHLLCDNVVCTQGHQPLHQLREISSGEGKQKRTLEPESSVAFSFLLRRIWGQQGRGWRRRRGANGAWAEPREKIPGGKGRTPVPSPRPTCPAPH